MRQSSVTVTHPSSSRTHRCSTSLFRRNHDNTTPHAYSQQSLLHKLWSTANITGVFVETAVIGRLTIFTNLDHTVYHLPLFKIVFNSVLSVTDHRVYYDNCELGRARGVDKGLIDRLYVSFVGIDTGSLFPPVQCMLKESD